MVQKTFRILRLVCLTVILFFGVIPVFGGLDDNIAFAEEFAGGAGTPDNPYQIATADQLNKVREHLDKSFELVADIDLSGYSEGSGWLPIGSAEGALSFSGSMDGNGHTIRNLTIHRPDRKYVGLFGATTNSSQMTNMRLENVNIDGEQYTGGLVGRDLGEIRNSYVTGRVVGHEFVGGLAGTTAGMIRNVFTEVDVEGNSHVGGLIGLITSGGVILSYATGTATGHDTNVGGLAGSVEPLTTPIIITNSYARVNVTGNGAGGFIGGFSMNTKSATISNSYASGNVSDGPGNVGFAPAVPMVTVLPSFYDRETTGHSGKGSGRGLSTAEMKTMLTYVNAGWNMESTWAIDDAINDGYPYLINNHKYMVSYDKNGMDVSGEKPSHRVYTSITTVIVEGQGNLARTGYSFMGWNTHADGSGITYQAGESFTVKDNITLYAMWSSSNASLASISSDQGVWERAFHPADPSETEYSIDVDHSVTSLQLTVEKAETIQTVTVTNATYVSTDHLIETYTMSNLAVGENSAEVRVTAQDHSSNLYTIKVVRAPADLVVHYDRNGVDVTGTVPADEAYAPGSTVTVADKGDLARTGYSFMEWNTKADGSGITYQAGDTFTIVEDITLYAIWGSSNASPASISSHVGTWSNLYSSDDLSGSRYTIQVDHSVTELQLTVEKAESIQTVTVTNATYVSTDHLIETYTISNLAVGENIAEVHVTSQDDTTNIYHITVNRGERREALPYHEIFCHTRVSNTGILTLPPCWGGEVSLGEQVSVSIPLGALHYSLEITIHEVSDWEELLAGGEILASSVWEVTKNRPESFLKPVEMMLMFDPDQVQMDEGQSVGLFYYNGDDNAWVALADSKLEGSQIMAKTNQFGTFAVLVVEATTGLPVIKVESVFHDIAGHWAERFIVQAERDNLVHGYPDQSFQPDRSVTRAEFIVMLANALQLDGVMGSIEFVDAQHIGSWAMQSIALGVHRGIVHGYEDGSFRPNAEITRAEMAVMIARALSLPLEDDISTDFADESTVPAWAKSAVAALSQLGIISGRDHRIFAPNDSLVRAEAVIILLKLLEHESDL